MPNTGSALISLHMNHLDVKQIALKATARVSGYECSSILSEREQSTVFRRWMTAVAVLFLLWLQGCAATGPKGAEMASALGALPPGFGRIVFYRSSSIVGAAVHALEAAIAREEAERQAAIDEAAALGEAAPQVEGISLRQRAVPLIDMLRRSAAVGKEVVWGL